MPQLQAGALYKINTHKVKNMIPAILLLLTWTHILIILFLCPIVIMIFMFVSSTEPEIDNTDYLLYREFAKLQKDKQTLIDCLLRKNNIIKCLLKDRQDYKQQVKQLKKELQNISDFINQI